MKHNSYNGGFDLIRLLGCILVALAHIGLLDPFYNALPFNYNFILVVVPLFFLISGYLMQGKATWHYTKKYIIKYALLYLIASLISAIYIFGRKYLLYGTFDAKQLLAGILTLPVRNAFNGSLWFVPYLLFGVFFIWLSNEKHLPVWIPLAIGALCLILGTFVPGFNQRLSPHRMAQGLILVTLGALLKRSEHPPVWLLVLICLGLTIIEQYTVYLGLATMAWSVLVFLGILRISAPWLQKWHVPISLFSCIMFFGHMIEFTLLSLFVTENVLLQMAAILLMNAVISWIIYRRILSKSSNAVSAETPSGNISG